MRLVSLVSGGLDSALMSVVARESGAEVLPLFIDYGQRAAKQEWDACQRVCRDQSLGDPERADVSGYGRLIRSGLTDSSLDVREDAFTPGRNHLLLLVGSAYAFQERAGVVAIGLLAEQHSLFPDQRSSFLDQAAVSISASLGMQIEILAPLIEFGKQDVIRLAAAKGIRNTYSCHIGDTIPCGKCIACCEFHTR